MIMEMRHEAVILAKLRDLTDYRILGNIDRTTIMGQTGELQLPHSAFPLEIYWDTGSETVLFIQSSDSIEAGQEVFVVSLGNAVEFIEFVFEETESIHHRTHLNHMRKVLENNDL